MVQFVFLVLGIFLIILGWDFETVVEICLFIAGVLSLCIPLGSIALEAFD